jgi:uncharacterized membrane protein YuzA (DUF378 family)
VTLELVTFINNKSAFGWTWLVYTIVGVFGVFAITGVNKRENTTGSTVLDFFEINWIVCLIEVILNE